MRNISATALLLVACGGAPAPATPTPSAPAAPVANASSTECFYGHGKVVTPDGIEVAQTEALARRTLDPGSSTITEEFVSLTPQVQRWTVQMKVDGQTFTMTEASGAFAGDGDLVGEPWQWTSWTSRSALPDGIAVVSTDTRTEGGVSVLKAVSAPDGAPMVTITEELALISTAECDERFAALPAAP